MTRCEMTDLPVDGCAHCHGDLGPDIEPSLRLADDGGHGWRVWPPERPTVPRPAKPAPEEEPSDDPRVQVTRDLRAILAMTRLLDERGEDLSDSPDLPGGLAVVVAAPVASPSAWEALLEAKEAAWFAALTGPYDPAKHPGYGADDDDEWEPPLQTLLFWSEQWRQTLTADGALRRPTIHTEARFLSGKAVLDWAWDNLPEWDNFAEDVADARGRMENVVRDGIRELRSRVVCDRCQTGKRLIRKWGKAGRPDVWKAPCCKAEFTEDEAKRALARQLRSSGVERFVERAEAVSAIMVQGWSEAEVLRMLNDPHDPVACVCVPGSRVTRVWWPDLWRKHLLAVQERDERARLRADRAARKAACVTAHGEDCWHRGRCRGRIGA